TYHRIFGAKNPSDPFEYVEWAIVADLIGAVFGIPNARNASVQTIAAVCVVGLPSRVRCLVQNIGVTVVVTYDEENLGCSSGIVADGAGKIDAGNRIWRHIPGS